MLFFCCRFDFFWGLFLFRLGLLGVFMVEDGVRRFLLVFFGFIMEEDGLRWILKFFLDFDLGKVGMG